MRTEGQIHITNELLHRLLGLPDEVKITAVEPDTKRGIVSLIVRSEEPVSGLTVLIGEGCEAPSTRYYSCDEEILPFEMKIYERVRDRLIGTLPGDEGAEV